MLNHPAVEGGIPRPPMGQSVAHILARAPIGFSMFFPSKAKRSAAVLSNFIRKPFGTGWASSRKVEGGFRVWKVKEPKGGPY